MGPASQMYTNYSKIIVYSITFVHETIQLNKNILNLNVYCIFQRELEWPWRYMRNMTNKTVV